MRDKVGATEFLGYDTETAEVVVTALLKGGVEIDRLAAGEEGIVLVNQTPFYAESGGQVGDHGRLTGDGIEAAVIDVKKRVGDVFAHHVR